MYSIKYREKGNAYFVVLGAWIYFLCEVQENALVKGSEFFFINFDTLTI